MTTQLDPSELKADLKDAATRVASEVEERAGELKDEAGDCLKHAGSYVREKGCCAQIKAQDLIRRKPLPSMVGFAALGFALGYVICRCRSRPIFDSDELASAFAPLGKRLRHQYQDLKDRGADALESVQARLPHQAVDRALGQARDFGKTLKFW